MVLGIEPTSDEISVSADRTSGCGKKGACAFGEFRDLTQPLHTIRKTWVALMDERSGL